QQGRAAKECGCFKIAQHIVLERVDGAVQDVCAPVTATERIAIRRRTRDSGSANAPRCTGYVFNEDGLPEPCFHELGQDSCSRVSRAARGVPYDYRDWPGRKCLRSRRLRDDRQRNGARGQLHKCAASELMRRLASRIFHGCGCAGFWLPVLHGATSLAVV